MKITQLELVIQAMFKLKRPLAIEGPPGGGKTSVVQSCAKAMDCGYIEKHLPTMLVEDLGIPNMLTTEPTFDYKMPAWYPAADRTDIKPEGILCFDDRNQASPDLQKVIANICQERTLHNVPIMPGWMIIATGNRQKDRAGANRVLSHLRNRETIITLQTDYEDWAQWAIDNDIAMEIIAFLKYRPQHLHGFDPDADQNPTPRSWSEGVSPILGLMSKSIERECIEGAVGETAGSEFAGYMEIYRTLPDIDQILKKPMEADLPEDAVVKYALVGALANKATTVNIGNIMKYLYRFGADEFAILCMYMVEKKEPLIHTTAAYIEWVNKNHDLIFDE